MGHFLFAQVVLRKDAFHHAAAFSRRGRGPCRKGGFCGGDGGVRIRLTPQRDHGADIFGRGVDDRAIPREFWGDPLAVDVELTFGDHGRHLG